MAKSTKVHKNFTYYAIIKEAIESYPHCQATSAEIFSYVMVKHPTLFRMSNSMTWKGNIRQLLSKHPEFVKLRKDGESKLHLWTHRTMADIEAEESRLQSCLTHPFRMGRYPPMGENNRDYSKEWTEYNSVQEKIRGRMAPDAYGGGGPYAGYNQDGYYYQNYENGEDEPWDATPWPGGPHRE